MSRFCVLLGGFAVDQKPDAFLERQRIEIRRSPLFLEGLGHVIGNGPMAAPVGRTGVAGDPLTLVEDLDGVVGDAHIDELADEAIGRGIPVPVDLDMIVGRDAATLPARKDVWLICTPPAKAALREDGTVARLRS